MLHHITLHLARSKQFPEGSLRYGYEITAPLNGEGHLDREEWATKRAHSSRSTASGPTRVNGREFSSIGRAGRVEQPG